MRSAKNRQKGVALVEFALVLPLLLILTFITTEYGRALYQYNTITKSVRDAARYLSIQSPNTHVAEAKNLAVYGNLAGAGTPLAIGLDTGQVQIAWPAPTGAAPVINTVTIRVSGYTFSPMFTNAFGLNFSNILYGDISATMRSPT
jgi:Flp pilus assembly protein TadG